MKRGLVEILACPNCRSGLTLMGSPGTENDVEYILFLRKGGGYRSLKPVQKALSMLTKEEMQTWFVSFWTDIKGASTRSGHPAPFPSELAERLIKMFSFAGDTVLDPFAGTGSTCLAAMNNGRNSIGNEIDPAYLQMAKSRLSMTVAQPKFVGATSARLFPSEGTRLNEPELTQVPSA